jgi:hypothetical protein
MLKGSFPEAFSQKPDESIQEVRYGDAPARDGVEPIVVQMTDIQSGIRKAFHLGNRSTRYYQKLEKLPIASSIETFSYVRHHRDGGSLDLIPEAEIPVAAKKLVNVLHQ